MGIFSHILSLVQFQNMILYGRNYFNLNSFPLTLSAKKKSTSMVSMAGEAAQAAIILLRLTCKRLQWAQTLIVSWMDNNMSALWMHDQVLYDTPLSLGT